MASETTATPRRVRLRRTKGWRKPPNTVVVARPSKWGNPFPVKYKGGELGAVILYKQWLLGTPEGGRVLTEARTELRGKNLACWCREDLACHADLLIEIANSESDAELGL